MRYLILFSYMFATRYKTIAYKCAFLLVYLFPLLIIVFIDKADIWLFLFAFLGTNCIYENGYIDNDIITTQWENKPTIRVNGNQQEEFKKKYLLMRAFRDMGFIVFGIGIWGISLNAARHYFLLGSLLIVTYGFHNTIRSAWNIITFSLLLVLKYAVPVICACGESAKLIWNLVSIWFVICVPRIFEYTLKYLKNRETFTDRLDQNRFMYYIFVAVSSGLICMFNDDTFVFFVLAVYYLLFRGTAYLLREQKSKWKQMEEDRE